MSNGTETPKGPEPLRAFQLCPLGKSGSLTPPPDFLILTSARIFSSNTITVSMECFAQSIDLVALSKWLQLWKLPGLSADPEGRDWEVLKETDAVRKFLDGRRNWLSVPPSPGSEVVAGSPKKSHLL